jgi:ANTAR domain-containing protein
MKPSESRSVIEQARGVLSERLGVEPDDAFCFRAAGGRFSAP